jgi:hypothetical protein
LINEKNDSMVFAVAMTLASDGLVKRHYGQDGWRRQTDYPHLINAKNE